MKSKIAPSRFDNGLKPITLLYCPFCGEIPDLQAVDLPAQYLRGHYRIVCRCGISTNSEFGIASAINKWNCRCKIAAAT